MDVSLENVSTLGRRLKVVVPEAKVAEAVKTRMIKLGKTAHIKGFRKGKVPAKVLQERFGPSVRNEAVSDLISGTLTEVLEEKALNVAGRPIIEEVKAEENTNLEYVATFEVFPEIDLSNISSIEVEKRACEVTSDDIEKMIEKLKDQFANWNEVDRASKIDDKIMVDFDHELEGEKDKPEVQENVDIILGAEGLLPGLSEGLVGKKAGDVVELSLTYPDTWEQKGYAGKKGNFKITVHKVSEKQPLTQDELIEKFKLEEKNEAKLKETIAEKMQSELDKKLNAETKEVVLDALIKNIPLELPKSLVNQEKASLKKEIESNAYQGVTESPEEELQEMAEKRVILGLLVREYIAKKQIKVDPKKVRKEIENLAAAYGGSQEIVNLYYSEQRLLDGVERSVLLDQAVDAMLEEMKVNTKSATFDEVMNSTEQADK